MAFSLNKTALKERRDHLAMYRRFLPSLDLKRRQLLAEFQRARGALAGSERETEQALASQAGLFRLLGASEQQLSGLVRVEVVESGDENVLGVRLPVLKKVEFARAEYSMLAKPFWVDFMVELLEQMAVLRIRIGYEKRRVELLNEAVRRITQRVNLFEKVLIPGAERDIQRIRIYLADVQRAAVVNSKIAKAKQQRSAGEEGYR